MVNDIKKIKFNKAVFPYLAINVYDYEKNDDVTVKIGTTELEKEIERCLKSSDKQLQKLASEFDSDFIMFLPSNELVKTPENILVDRIQNLMSIGAKTY